MAGGRRTTTTTLDGVWLAGRAAGFCCRCWLLLPAASCRVKILRKFIRTIFSPLGFAAATCCCLVCHVCCCYFLCVPEFAGFAVCFACFAKKSQVLNCDEKMPMPQVENGGQPADGNQEERKNPKAAAMQANASCT